MLEGIEALIQYEQSDWVLVYGDTNAALAGALAAVNFMCQSRTSKPACARSTPFRKKSTACSLTISQRCCCAQPKPPCATAKKLSLLDHRRKQTPTKTAHRKRRRCDVRRRPYYCDLARERDRLKQGPEHQGYALCTLHRQENIKVPVRLISILSGLLTIAQDQPVVPPRIRVPKPNWPSSTTAIAQRPNPA